VSIYVHFNNNYTSSHIKFMYLNFIDLKLNLLYIYDIIRIFIVFSSIVVLKEVMLCE